MDMSRQLIVIVLITSAAFATDAACVGTPHPCAGRSMKGVCESIQGCQWISTGSATWDGYCEGTPFPCNQLSDEPRLSCLNQGCEYQADLPQATASPTTAPVEPAQPVVDPTTGSFCTGTPHPCAGGTKSICESVEGCLWTSTGSATWDGYCEGTPSPCSHFTNEPRLSCLKQGCGYQVGNVSTSLCTGTPFPTPVCSGTLLYDSCSPSEKRICEGILGCEWISTGTATWDGYCEGTPIPCNHFSDDGVSCIRQKNCQYVKDPPNPEESFYDAIMPLDLDFVCQLPVDYYEWDDSQGLEIWVGTHIVCDKCHPSSDGYVCYTEKSFWSLSGEHGGLGLISHENVLKIEEDYCDSEFCDDGTTAFNCQKVLIIDEPSGRVVGQDCSGNCIWKMPTNNEDYEIATPGTVGAPGDTPGATQSTSPTPGSTTAHLPPTPYPSNDVSVATQLLISSPAPATDSRADPSSKMALLGLGVGSMLILI